MIEGIQRNYSGRGSYSVSLSKGKNVGRLIQDILNSSNPRKQRRMDWYRSCGGMSGFLRRTLNSRPAISSPTLPITRLSFVGNSRQRQHHTQNNRGPTSRANGSGDPDPDPDRPLSFGLNIHTTPAAPPPLAI